MFFYFYFILFFSSFYFSVLNIFQLFCGIFIKTNLPGKFFKCRKGLINDSSDLVVFRIYIMTRNATSSGLSTLRFYNSVRMKMKKVMLVSAGRKCAGNSTISCHASSAFNET